MPTVEGHGPLTGRRMVRLTENKPTICSIASHAYWNQVSNQRELKYATSFQKTHEYLDSLREEVTDGVFKESIHHNTTPQYVFEEVKGLYHSPEHPLINKGLLASTKHEQLAGYTTPVEQPWPSNLPKPLSPNRSFYRPNSTHNYLTKTIALNGSHDGFNPRHGTPTRAQLLRNRVKFTSAPDLTYSYIAQRRSDGKHEADHRKAKMTEEALQLKASRIEMDKTAGKYRKYMIGSRYNTSKWIDSHLHIVSGMVATRSDRPASSFTPKSAPLTASSKRRATSAVANSELLRRRAERPKIKDDGTVNNSRSYPISSYSDTRSQGTNRKLSTRSPNLVPYTTSVNCTGKSDPLISSIIIKSAMDMKETKDTERLKKRIDSARHLKSQIASSVRSGEGSDNSKSSPLVRAPTPSLALSQPQNTKESYETEAPLSPVPKPVFITHTANDPADINSVQAVQSVKTISSIGTPSIKVVNAVVGSKQEEVENLSPNTEMTDPLIVISATSPPVIVLDDQSVPVTPPVANNASDTVSVEPPTMDNTLDTVPVERPTVDNTLDAGPVEPFAADNTSDTVPVEPPTVVNTSKAVPVEPSTADNTSEAVPVEPPTVDNTSDTLSISQDYTSDEVTETADYMAAPQINIHVDTSLANADVVEAVAMLHKPTDVEKSEQTETTDIKSSEEDIVAVPEAAK